MLSDHEEHRPYEDLAVRHVMGGLDDAESATFRSHLLDCTECRARVGELRSIASELAEVERAERRERAAQRVETKERAAEPAPKVSDVDAGPPRGLKTLMMFGILLVIVLSVWNFLLRGQSEGLRDDAEAFAASAETINFGEPWATAQVSEGHGGVARELDEHLAVMVRGVDDQALYELALRDDSGDVVQTYRLTPRDGTVHWFGGPLPEGTFRVEVSIRRDGGQSVVYRATAPG